MTRFKDAVAADIKGTFINALEFADLHDINGTELLCVIDGDIIQERNARTYSEYAEGVFKSQKMVFVAVDDLPERPVKGEIFRLDGELYMVDECAENMGVLEITIEANDS
jgi:hypothetical protein